MKLSKLTVKNFRNITDTTLDTGGAKLVVLRGKNKQGKTSLAEALSLTLTDTTWGLDKRGAGYVRKIKRGETKATLEAELQGARTIKRTVTLNVNSLGRTQESEDLADPEWVSTQWDNLLVKKKAALDISINTRAFMSMVYSRDEDAQKNLLAQLVLPAKYDFAKETIADVEKYLGTGVVNFDGEPFAAINLAYKKLFDERKEANKKLKEFQIPAALPRPQGVDSESLAARLSVLKEERQTHTGERDAAQAKVSEDAQRRARENAKIDTLEAALNASTEALRTLQGHILANPAIVESIASRKIQEVQLRGELQRLSHSQEAAKAESTRLRELAKVGATCPTCDQDIDEAKLAQLMQSSNTERDRLTEAYQKATKTLNSLGDVDEAVSKIEKHKKALAEKTEIEQKIEQQAQALKAAKDELARDAGTLFDATTFDDSLAKADAEIEKILQQIQPVVAAEERDKEIATKKEQLKRLEDKAAKLDTLVEVFGKDGIKANLIKDHIGGFEEKVNSVLSAWDYSCSLSIEPFKFEVTTNRKDTMPIIELSGAEELMFYAAFQCAVSKTAGIGFVVIDQVDRLLADLRPLLVKKLYGMVTSKVLDQVILLVADLSVEVPKSLADSAFFVVEDGNVRRLG